MVKSTTNSTTIVSLTGNMLKLLEEMGRQTEKKKEEGLSFDAKNASRKLMEYTGMY